MIVNFTLPPQKYDAGWMGQTLDSIKRSLLRVVSQSEATPRLILRSSNGTIYSVTVSDAGALVVAAESGKDGTY